MNRVAAALLAQQTMLGDQWFSVANVLVHTGEVNLALTATELAVEQCSGSPQARFQRAQILSKLGKLEEAIALVSAIEPRQLGLIERDHFLGVCALEAGDFGAARDAFDRALALWQGSGPTWLSIAALPATDDAILLERLNSAAAVMKATPQDYRAQWHYAKGTVLDRLGRSDEAFSEFAAGAELVRPTRRYDPDADRREAEMLTAEFTEAAIDRLAQQVTTDTSRPVIVTGIPRSGTTLVEQILTSHSAIAGGGEMTFGAILTSEVRGKSRDALESFASARGMDHLARLYLHMGDEHFGEGERFVDKGLGNSRALGVLASALPQARIIWLRRDPLDCAWSCFRTYFSQGIEWSWSLADIAAHFEAEDRLHSHWAEVLGERMLTLSYEDLTADAETQIARMLGHLGLDAEERMGTAHQTRRPVTTASVTQVRQPIYRSSVGAASRYRKQLQPFVEAYRAKSGAQ